MCEIKKDGGGGGECREGRDGVYLGCMFSN